MPSTSGSTTPVARFVAGATCILLLGACADAATVGRDAAGSVDSPDAEAAGVDTAVTSTTVEHDLSTDAYLGEYALVSEDHGSTVTVTLTDTERSLEGNGLPNHETGDFPNSGNPNSISEQSVSATFPLEPSYTGEAVSVKEPGLSIAGVKFDPQTAETATCSDGTTYRIEAIQDVVDLGLDSSNAHVQPTGAYHYHGVPTDLVEGVDTGGDLVHVGFAYDGHLIVYSKSGAYSPSYGLATAERTGTGCSWVDRGSGETLVFDGATPDGSFVEDWVYVAGAGDLDECNGIVIDGRYVYLLTDDHPYVPRCLMGAFDASQTGPGAGGGDRGGQPGG